VGIEFLAQAGQGLLPEMGLDPVDDELQTAGDEHRCQVEGAVPHQQIKLLQANRLVDNLFLHLKGKDPDHHIERDHHQKEPLQLHAAGSDPVDQGTLGNHLSPHEVPGFESMSAITGPGPDTGRQRLVPTPSIAVSPLTPASKPFSSPVPDLALRSASRRQEAPEFAP